MIYIVILLIAFCGGALAQASYQSNLYVDNVLRGNLQNEAAYSNVDPARLANFTAEHKDKVMFIKVNVRLQYSNGQMKGMMKVRRVGDCSPLRRNYNNVTLNCTLVFDDVKIKYEAHMKYGKLPTVNIKAESKMAPSYFYLETTTEYSRNIPAVKQIHLTQTGQQKEVKISGLGPLNSTLKKLTEEGFKSRVTSEFFNVFTYNFVPALQRAVSRSPMPLI